MVVSCQKRLFFIVLFLPILFLQSECIAEVVELSDAALEQITAGQPTSEEQGGFSTQAMLSELLSGALSGAGAFMTGGGNGDTSRIINSVVATQSNFALVINSPEVNISQVNTCNLSR